MSEPTPWDDLDTAARENFAALLNRELDADLSVDEAARYYGSSENLKADYGETLGGGAPACSNCFKSLDKSDIRHLKQTNRCPHCGEDLRVQGGRDE